MEDGEIWEEFANILGHVDMKEGMLGSGDPYERTLLNRIYIHL